MPLNSRPADDRSQDAAVTGPLSTLELPSRSRPRPSVVTAVSATDAPEQPLALRALRPAPRRDLPDHVYDPVRQVAVDLAGRPLAPTLGKDWTSLEGTHTDGDGGDNETWDWEENNK
ncbi:putative ATP-grasp-modified RiPP [Amycolatopsis sp. cmx-11-51]|uniref:putative ATP-grasp-modified RiPP n=1 Tax=Amycolatopsis sp. cmx-11-51 TaxID=2785797 RepID=UPI0039E6A373